MMNILRGFDTLWSTLRGYTPDFERLSFVHKERRLFSNEGLVKERLSLIPFDEFALKRVVEKYGGWQKITRENFIPPEELLAALENAGLSRTDFLHSREFLASPSDYRKRAISKRGRL